MMIDLKQYGLRDTQPRRLVVDALEKSGAPASPQDIHARIASFGATVNLVTVYRVLELFEQLGLVHRHPCDGQYTLCSLPHAAGHHGFLHCHDCGNIEEFLNSDLCRVEDAIAKKFRFQPSSHVSEILGTCRSCSRS